MSRGQPDFGMYAVKEVTGSVSDIGELAARLGSIVIYDRRGDVVDFDNFEGPVIKGVGPARVYPFGVFLTSEAAKSGSQCLRLRPEDTIDAYAFIGKYHSFLASAKLGVEYSFVAPANQAYIYLYFTRLGLTHTQTVGIEINLATGDLYLYNETGGLIYLTTLNPIYSNLALFHTLKLVANFGEGKYMRFLFGDVEVDLSAYNIESLVIASAPHFFSELGVTNKTNSEVILYVDDYILTQAEP